MIEKTKNVKKIFNRAFNKNRPTKIHELRSIDNTLKTHFCHKDNGGHDYRFYPFDNYGCCSKCGSEILV